jgi:hypothetical protein
LLFLGLVLPVDWRRLMLKVGSAEVAVERAEAAQETLASLPREAQRELLPAEGLPTGEEPLEGEGDGLTEEEAVEAAEAAGELTEARAQLIRNLLTTPAFASHERGTRWVQLRLKRQAPETDSDLAVACAIRKPGGEFMVGVPRLVSPTEPPMILGAFPRGGTWLSYEAIFPDFFTDADENEEFPDGRYVVIWGTLAREGRRSHVLATDAFSWPPNAAA